MAPTRTAQRTVMPIHSASVTKSQNKRNAELSPITRSARVHTDGAPEQD